MADARSEIIATLGEMLVSIVSLGYVALSGIYAACIATFVVLRLFRFAPWRIMKISKTLVPDVIQRIAQDVFTIADAAPVLPEKI